MIQELKLNKWYVWVCGTIGLLGVFVFIIAETYAFHPTEIRIFANDEMVATSENLLSAQRDINYNNCLEMCTKTNSDSCFSFCMDYYEDYAYEKNWCDDKLNRY